MKVNESNDKPKDTNSVQTGSKHIIQTHDNNQMDSRNLNEDKSNNVAKESVVQTNKGKHVAIKRQ